MHTFLLLLKSHRHLEIEWLCATLGMGVMAAVTLDMTVIIVTLIGLVQVIATLWFAYISKKMERVSMQTQATVIETQKEVADIKHSTNSLLEVAKIAKEAEGRLKGVEEERGRKALEDQAIAKGQDQERARKGTEDQDVQKGVDKATKLEVDLKLPPAIKDKLELP